MTINLTVRLPKPHPKQIDFITSQAKRKVIVAGRRVGKTTGVSIDATQKFLAGRRVLYAAPTQEQTDAFWKAVTRYLAPLVDAKVLYKNETERVLEMRNANPPRRLRAKTAWDADTLRGDYADELYLEEWSLMKKEAWDEVGAPMLLDNDGNATFIFTPKRKNHAYETYQRAVSDESGRWQAWHFTSFDNPHLSKDALDEITRDMTEDAYRQEILAEFLESSGSVFRNVKAVCTVTTPDTPEAHAGHSFVAGIDWAKAHDYTRIRAGCRDCRKVVDWDGFNQIDFHFQRERLRVLYDKWKPERILAESNSIGEPNIEELSRSGLPVYGFATTGASKPPLIESLALAIERGEWQLPQEDANELEAYEMKQNANTGRPTYSAPEGGHDDRVMADALMLWAATHGRASADWV